LSAVKAAIHTVRIIVRAATFVIPIISGATIRAISTVIYGATRAIITISTEKIHTNETICFILVEIKSDPAITTPRCSIETEVIVALLAL
jgi:hypothetical protein